MKIGHRLGNVAKMSVGWWYSGACCPECYGGPRWSWRGGIGKNNKSKTLRTHRTGDMGRNNRRTNIFNAV